MLLYSAVALVAIGASAMAGARAPLHAAALTFPVPWVAPLVSMAGVTAMLGVILSQLLGLSRMTFAMARRGDLPVWLASMHPRHHVPRRAVILVGAIAAIVAATGTLREIPAAASFTILVYYGIANMAALRMPLEAKLYPDVVPALGLASCTLLAFSLPLPILVRGTLVLVAGLALRLLLVGSGAPSTRGD